MNTSTNYFQLLSNTKEQPENSFHLFHESRRKPISFSRGLSILISENILTCTTFPVLSRKEKGGGKQVTAKDPPVWRRERDRTGIVAVKEAR